MLRNSMIILAVSFVFVAVASGAVIISTSGDTDPIENGFSGYGDISGVATTEDPGDPTSAPTWKFASSNGQYYTDIAEDPNVNWTIDYRVRADNQGSAQDLGMFLTVTGHRIEVSVWGDGTIRFHNGSWTVLGNHNFGFIDGQVAYDAAAQTVTWTFGGDGTGGATYSSSELSELDGSSYMKIVPSRDSDSYVSLLTLSSSEVPEPATLLGDANNDGVVSAGDYASVQANFGNTGEAGILGDANGDGVVSAGDYASVQANFGNTAAEVVPEPATLSLLGLGVLAVIRRKRRA